MKKFEDLTVAPGKVVPLPSYYPENSLCVGMTDQKFPEEWREQSKMTAEEQRLEEQADKEAMAKVPAFPEVENEYAEEKSLTSQLRIGPR